MGETTGISWTDSTWNPTVGCAVVSPGCTNCYAMKMAGTRLVETPIYRGLTKPSKAGPVWTGEVRVNEKALTLPLRWRKPRRIFVNSMSDLFHENLPDEAIDRVFAVMALAPQHTFQVLTKRSARMREYATRLSRSIAPLEKAARDLGYTFKFEGRPLLPWPIRNVWLGVSCEDQARADERISDLLATPAAVRFISAEPLLGPLDLRVWMPDDRYTEQESISWVIAGGESGPGARPFDVAWARSLRDQCKAAGVACFVKQMGANVTGPHANGINVTTLKFRDRAGGDPSEWPADLRVREFPA